MRVLVCTFSFPCNKLGVSDGRFIYSEVVGYAANGAEVVVLTPHFPGAERKENIDDKIKIVRFPYFFPLSLESAKKPGRPVYDTDSLFALLQFPVMCFAFMLNIMKYSREVDIIHAQWTPVALLALPAKWIFKKKIVVTARGSDIRLLPVWLNRYIFRKVDAAIDCFGPVRWNIQNKAVFNANYITLPLLVLDDSSGEIPPEIRMVKEVDTEIFIILYVGRFHQIKLDENKLPLFELLYACKELKNSGAKCHVVYVGNGNVRMIDEMKETISKLEIQDQVTLAGSKTNVLDYMKNCDLGVGGIAFNGVSQEFTICKKPQVLINSPDNSDIPWNTAINCLKVNPHDINDLTDKINWAINNKEAAKALGIKANHDMKAYFNESHSGGNLYIQAFESLLN